MTSLLPIPIKMEMVDSYRSLPDDGTDFIRSKKGAQKGLDFWWIYHYMYIYLWKTIIVHG